MNIFEDSKSRLMRERIDYLNKMHVESLMIRCCRHMLWCGYCFGKPGADVLLQVVGGEQHIVVRKYWTEEMLLADEEAFYTLACLHLRAMERSVEMVWES